MENFALVDVLYCPADLDEKLEDSIFGKEFASLPVDLGVEVATLAILHHNAHRSIKQKYF